MSRKLENPVLLFDGDCAFCNRSVRLFVRLETRPGVVRFAPLRSEPGRVLLGPHGLDPDTLSSLVFLEGDSAYTRSAALIRIGAYLRAPWRWARVFGVLPRPLMDGGYRLVARSRHLLGNADRCTLEPGIAERML